MKSSMFSVLGAFALGLLGAASATASDHVVYQAKPGAGQGRHVVLLSGDEEYRSEEVLPALGQILSQHHGFKATVLFSLAADGTIDPKNQKSLSHPEALDSADAIIFFLRFRDWPEATFAKLDAAVKRGVPLIALRTSTHAFNVGKDSPWAKWSWGNEGGFGKKVFGETWVTHWGVHKQEATKGVIETGAAGHALLRGVGEVFGDTDVYEAYPPADAKILLRGQVLTGMTADTAPASYSKKRASDQKEQPVNDPMMPVAWVREVKNDAGTVNKVFTSTMGAASDFQNEGLRRLVINAVFWGLNLDVPAKADVTLVSPWTPTPYGFDGFKKGVKPADYALPAAK